MYVKCTGTTPQCERCSKRDIKCEYIPCSQQKAASSSPPMRPSFPEYPVRPAAPSYRSSPSLHRSSTSWPQAGGAVQGFYPDGSNLYRQQNDWPDQAFGASLPESQVTPPYFNGVPGHPRATRTHYGVEDYSQEAYGYQTFGEPSTIQPGFPSHHGYTGGPIPSGYPSPEINMGPGDPALSYAYSADHGRVASQARATSQHS